MATTSVPEASLKVDGSWYRRVVVEFEYHYSEEQERFRREVDNWLTANLPREVQDHEDLLDSDWFSSSSERGRILQRKLGEQGWLAPTDPSEWGGGGLTPDHALVVIEELGKRGLAWLLKQGNPSVRRALNEWGTEVQKGDFLIDITQGRATIWNVVMESGAEMDSGDIGVRAFLEGDDYVLDGEATFEGVGSAPDYFWTIAVTDPDMPANKCSGAFLVPASSDGINIQTSDTLVPGEVHHVQFDKVWIPTNCLMGEDGNGWSLMQSTLLENEVADYPSGQDEDVTGLIQYASETNRYGMAISKHPFFQQLLMEVYVNSERVRVLRIRNAWMAETGQTLTYHIPQVSLMEKQASLRLSQVVREIMGIYAMLGPEDPLAPMRGKYNLHQKRSLVQQNPTEGPEVQAAAIAKHLGLDALEGKGIAHASPHTATGVSPSQ